MTAKPIAVIYLPSDVRADGEKITWKDCANTQKKLDEDKPDYYWFVLLKNDTSDVEFKVFYEKEFTEIQYAELKNIIEQAIANNKTNE